MDRIIRPVEAEAINAAMAGEEPPRPLTHDLFVNVLRTFGAIVQRILIVRVEEDVFFARLFLEAQNEIMEKMIVELDARPSDCIALAVRQQAPIYVLKEVWEKLKDMTNVLEELREEGIEFGPGE